MPLDGDINNQGLSDVKIHGAPTSWQEGKIGKCAKFNGDYKIILTETTHEFDYTNNFSWACWVLPVYSGTAQQYIFSVGRADYGSYGYGARLASATQINIRYGNAEWGIPCEASKWVHIAFVKQDGKIKTYKNGSLCANITYGGATPTYTESVGLTLGCFRFKNASLYPSFCSINDFRLYNTPLTDRQVKEISKGLVCHYPLGEVDGKIGGRNLIKNGKGNVKAGFFKNFPTVTDEYGEFTLKSKKTYATINLYDGFVHGCRGYTVGEKYTWSYDIMYTAWNFPTGSNRGEFWMGQRYTSAPSGETATGAWRAVTYHNLPVVGQNGCELNKWYHVKQTVTIPQQASSNVGVQYTISFYNTNANVEASFTARLKNVKLERSSTATPWTPAPEDDTSFYDNVIYDTSGYCNNGSVEGNILWDNNTPRYKGAYNFNQTGYIKNDGFVVYFKEFTISYWIKIPENTSSQHFAWGTFNNWTVNGAGSWRDSEKKYSAIVRSDTENHWGDFQSIEFTPNEWSFVSYVYTGTTIKTYKNGSLISNKTYGSNGSVYMPVVYLGNSLYNNHSSTETDECSMVDFRIYTTALSDSNILELYQSSASVDNNGNLMLLGEVIEE